MRMHWLAVVVVVASACGKRTPAETLPSGDPDFVTIDRGSPFSGGGSSADAGSSSAGGSGAPSGRSDAIEEADLYRVDQNRLFLLNTYRGFIIYDLSDPQNAKRLGRLPIYGYPVEMFVEGQTVYALVRDTLTLAQGDDLKVTRRNLSQLISIDISDLSHPKELKRIDIIGQLFEGVSRKVGNTLYVVSNANEQAWVYSFNVADPKNLELVEKLRVFEGGGTSSPNEGRWFGGLAISATSNTLHVVENWYGWSYSSDPAEGCSSYRSSEDAVVSIIDISNPDGHIRLHSKFSTPGSLTDQFKHTYVFDEATQKGYYLGIFALREWSSSNCTSSSTIRNTFETWDITDGAHPARVSALAFGHDGESVRGTAFDVKRKVAYAITARSIDPVYALDFSDPLHLRVASSIEGLSGDMSVFRAINDGQFLIGIGRDNASGCETNGAGGQGWTSSIAVSLIDVRDLAAIRLVQRKCVMLENSQWATSAVTWNLDQAHKMIGLSVDGPTSLVTVPVSYYSREDSGDGYAWYRPRSAVGLMSFDLSRYDPSKPATAQTVLSPAATVLHPSGTVARSILFTHQGDQQRLMVNLSDTHVSIFNIENPRAPALQSVTEVAPYHTRVYRFGDVLVDEVQIGGGSWWQPGASEFRIKRAASDADDAPALASFTVGRVDRVVQWQNLLLIFRPLGEVGGWYWRSLSKQTEVIAYDLSDPLHPARRGSTTVNFSSTPWSGYWCGAGWGYWPYWSGSNAGTSPIVSTSRGIAMYSRSADQNAVTDTLEVVDVTDASHLSAVSKVLFTHRSDSTPSTSVTGLISAGEASDGFIVTTSEVLEWPSAANEWFRRSKASAIHFNSALESDWSVNTPGAVIKTFVDPASGATRLLSTDSQFRAVTTNGYLSWYGEPRLHLLTRSGNTATLRDTLTLPGVVLGDLVGEANRLWLNVRPAWWLEYTPGVQPVDSLEAVDLSDDRLEVRSKTTLGTFGAQLMGLRGDRLFVNLPGAGVVVVDAAKLEAPKPVHFVPTLGYATHVALGDDRAYIAAGSYGIFEVAFDAPPTIANVP